MVRRLTSVGRVVHIQCCGLKFESDVRAQGTREERVRTSRSRVTGKFFGIDVAVIEFPRIVFHLEAQ